MEEQFSKLHEFLVFKYSIDGFEVLIKLNKNVVEQQDTFSFGFGQMSNMGSFVDVDGHSGIMGYLLKIKSDKVVNRDQYKINYFFVEQELYSLVFSVVRKQDCCEFMEKDIEFIKQYIDLIISQNYYKFNQRRLSNDIYRLWDILMVTMNHYINNELFIIKGKGEILNSIYPNEKIIRDILEKIDSVSSYVNKIEKMKYKVLSSQGKGAISSYIDSEQMINLD